MSETRGDGDARTTKGQEGVALAEELRVLWEGVGWQGDAWHGPSLQGLLGDLSADEAAGRPLGGRHSIWELVLHMTAWGDVWRRRLDGEAVDEPEAGDFPPVGTTTDAAWAQARSRLQAGNEALAERVARLTPEELEAAVAGQEYDTRFMVRGAIRHTVHHGGQIALLRKAAVVAAPGVG
jgi:uncharacterized damage-inducible protein DinB